MEDYKKKYKEALKIAKEWHKECESGDNSQRMKKLESMFSELAESEGENISEERKVLCDGCEEDCELRQNHIEWSEDDEAFLDDIICKVESDLILNKDEKNWLKSLKERCYPQKQWKPTEEQMIAIKQAEKSIYELWGLPYMDLKDIPEAKNYCCPKCGKEAPSNDEDGYKVDNEKYPIMCNEYLSSTMDGTIHDWLEIHKCPNCKTKFYFINGCF